MNLLQILAVSSIMTLAVAAAISATIVRKVFLRLQHLADECPDGGVRKDSISIQWSDSYILLTVDKTGETTIKHIELKNECE